MSPLTTFSVFFSLESAVWWHLYLFLFTSDNFLFFSPLFFLLSACGSSLFLFSILLQVSIHTFFFFHFFLSNYTVALTRRSCFFFLLFASFFFLLILLLLYHYFSFFFLLRESPLSTTDSSYTSFHSCVPSIRRRFFSFFHIFPVFRLLLLSIIETLLPSAHIQYPPISLPQPLSFLLRAN